MMQSRIKARIATRKFRIQLLRLLGNEGGFLGKVNEPVEFWVRLTNLLQIPARPLKNLGVFIIETTSNKP
jgi:hypothetical protein